MAYPRHLTLTEDERAKIGAVPAGSRLLKETVTNVSYPDGTEGQCRYERLGPACHRFTYRYQDGAHMSRRYFSKPLGNDKLTVSECATAMSEAAFYDAVDSERKNWFQRATESETRKRKADGTQFDAAHAREIAGQYCLCLKVGQKLIPVSDRFGSIDQAHAAWLRNKHTVIGCANRLDRRWEEPKYNPACADGHPRKEVAS